MATARSLLGVQHGDKANADGGPVSEPKLTREGNLRFAGLSQVGYPLDPETLISEVHKRLAVTPARAHGASLLWFSLPPEAGPPDRWDCQAGTAVVGLPGAGAGLLVEDYRNLLALSLPHAGPVRELSITWRRLIEHARRLSLGTVRPYWRLALRRRRMPDGNPLPLSELAVFLDR